jgi:Protein kinase domain
MMTPDNANTAAWMRLRDLFEAACALPASEQSAFVDAHTNDSPDLALSLARMLAAHAKHAGQTAQAHDQLLEQVDAAKAEAELPDSIDSGLKIGAFSLITEIGRGGMGVVWKAQRLDDVTQTVAIKILPPHRWDSASRARFQNERDALARLEHPGIARLVDAGTFRASAQADDAPFYVMEYVEGQSITGYAKAHKLSTHQRVHLFTQVLDAVDYAHRMLLIHRDLKPSNILVNTSGQVKLIDFGIAKNLSDAGEIAHTQTQQRFFSPSFAAPEQLRGQANSVAVDVYQLGAVLYELLSDKPMFDFQDASASEVERSILERVPAAPSRAAQARPRSGIDADLDAICLHCLRKEAHHRYASVAALQEDLRRVIANRAISIRQGQGWYRSAKFLRRNALSVGFAVTVLGLGAGFGWASWRQAQAVVRERDVAIVERRNAQETLAFLVKTFRSLDKFGQTKATNTLSDYVRNAIVLLRAQPSLEPAQRARLTMALAYAAQNNSELKTEFNSLLKATYRYAESTSNKDLALEALLLEAASRSSPYEAWEILQKIQNSKVTDKLLQLRVRLAVIRHKANNWQFEKDDMSPFLELQAIMATNAVDIKKDKYILSEYLLAMVKFLKGASPEKSIVELEGILSIYNSDLSELKIENAMLHEVLGQQYSNINNAEKALMHAKVAQKINLETYGSEHPQIEKDLSSIGKIYLFSGALPQSAASFREAIAHAERFGEMRLDAIAALSLNLGKVCQLQNDTQCAEAALARAVRDGAKVWKDNNPNVAIFRLEYGKQLLTLDDAPRAFKLFALARLGRPDSPELKLYAALEQLRLRNDALAKTLMLEICSLAVDIENEPARAIAVDELRKAFARPDCFAKR